MIYLILIYLLFIIADAYYQSHLIESGKWPIHWLHALIAVVIALVLSVIAKDGWEIIPFSLLLLSIRWIVFDISLNLFRGKHWLYMGEPDKDDALLDSLPWGDGINMLIVKIGLLIGMTLLTFL